MIYNLITSLATFVVLSISILSATIANPLVEANKDSYCLPQEKLDTITENRARIEEILKKDIDYFFDDGIKRMRMITNIGEKI